MTNDAAAETKARLRTDLRIALKGGRAVEARVIRALVAALDNAEAPPARSEDTALQHDFASGSAEIERLALGMAGVRAVLVEEIEERERAALEMERLGQTDRAQALRAEAAFARRYLD